jgi:hypothetical protein
MLALGSNSVLGSLLLKTAYTSGGLDV